MKFKIINYLTGVIIDRKAKQFVEIIHYKKSIYLNNFIYNIVTTD
jgi:hypothetical protein